jgi:sugar O-acyltransferase (sialic acid O-acetyltransferase NeuD family)
MIKEPILLIGGGGHCKSVIDVIEQQGKFSIKGIIDFPEKIGEKVLNYPIIAQESDLPKLIKEFKNIHITLGQLKTSDNRKRIFYQLLDLGANLPIIISPYAVVSPYAKIGIGTVILHQALINTGAVVGRNCIINSKALVEHDAIIGDHCHISTGAIINGGVRVGNNVFFGSGAVSKQYISIPDNSFIKANSLIK